jgi:uncharacterized protein (TIGR02599 family)
MKFAARKWKAAEAASIPESSPHRKLASDAFSIVELLVAAVILVILLGIIFSITQMISQSWGKSTAKIEAFQGARAAFDTVSRQVSQATLNTYYDYYDDAGKTRSSYGSNTTTFTPQRYGRAADLHFISGKSLVPNQTTHSIFFQAPVGYVNDTNYTGMDNLLNGCGFYVAYDKDDTIPAFVSGLPNKPADRFRFRLMQYLQPSQNLKVYDPSASSDRDWFQKPLQEPNPPVSILAENIITFVILPKLSKTDEDNAAANSKPSVLAAGYEYDTKKITTTGMTDSQLPPVVEVVVVAIDENSAQRFCVGSSLPNLGVDQSTLFQKSEKLEEDLKTLTAALNSKRITYRVFRSEVALRGAKWSSTP